MMIAKKKPSKKWLALLSAIVIAALVSYQSISPLGKNMNNAQAQQANIVFVPATSPSNYSYIIADITPSKITISRGTTQQLILNLTYSYRSTEQPDPQAVTVQLVPKHQYAFSPDIRHLPADQLVKKVMDGEITGKYSDGIVDLSPYISYSDNGPIQLQRGESKLVAMTISIPADFPDNMLNHPTIVNVGMDTNSHVGTLSNGVEMTVVE
jgi:hypothetical protein